MEALLGSGLGVLGTTPFGLVVESALKATLVMGGVALLCRAFGRAPASLRHLLWALGLGTVIVLPVATQYTPWRLALLPATSTPGVTWPEAQIASSAVAAEQVSAEAATLNSELAADAQGSLLVGPLPRAARSPGESPDRGRILAFLLVLVWGAGAFVVLVRSIRGSLRLHRIVGVAEPVTSARWRGVAERVAARTGLDELRLMRSSSLGVPAAVGLVRPSVLLPPAADGWTEDRLESVLLHEVAHLRRGDLYSQWLGRIACAFYWFHPMIWMAARRMHIEGERACDDLVLRAGVRASDYAEHLLCIARGADDLPVPAAALGLTGESDFERRVFAILEPAVRHDLPSRRSMVVAALAFACLALPVAALSALHVRDADAATQQPPVTQQVDPRGVAALVELLADSVREVRTAAIEALGDLRATSAVPQLLALLEDPSSSIRSRAARALGDIGDPRAVTPLSSVMALDRDRGARRAAVRALGDIGDAAATDFLIRAIRTSPDGSVRHEAVESLGEIGNQAAVDALAQLIESGEQRELTDEALESLAEIQTPAALEVLIRLTRSPDARIRRDAAQALGGRGGG